MTRAVNLKILPQRIEAAAEPKPGPSGNDDEPEMGAVPISNVTEVLRSLSNILLTLIYIFQVPGFSGCPIRIYR